MSFRILRLGAVFPLKETDDVITTKLKGNETNGIFFELNNRPITEKLKVRRLKRSGRTGTEAGKSTK